MRIEYPTSVVQTPGPTGAGGALPTYTTADFVIPAALATVLVSVISAAGFVLNQNVFVGGANFLVSGVDLSGSTVTLTALGMPNDAAAGNTVLANSTIVPGTGNLSAAEMLALGAQVGTTAAMVAGVVTVNTGITLSSASVILFSRVTKGGVVGEVSITATSVGGAGVASFTLTSESAAETSTFAYVIIG